MGETLLYRTHLTPRVQHFEQREVKLHELRRELLPVLAVVQRELIQQHGGVVLRLEPDASPETKRLHLSRDDAFHRRVLLAHDLEQKVRGVRRRPPLRVPELVHDYVQQRFLVLRSRPQQLVRGFDALLFEHRERIPRQRVERVHEARIRALHEILHVPVHEALALVRRVRGAR